MLIKAHGNYWNPDTVEWGSKGPGNKGKLIGTARIGKTTYEIDLWRAKGIYVLLDEFSPVYVGQAFARRLGPRLRDHLTDRFAGRWDMFSWFCVSSLNEASGTVRDPGKRYVYPATLVDTLEALAILVADPPLNRKREKIPGGVEVEQIISPHPHTIRHYLQVILKDINEMREEESA